MNDLFSVVIPVYNGQEFIQETLDSVFSQTYKNYELIVVDGNSSDETLQILNKNKGNIDILISENDSGMYNALNKGFKRASGDYFCYINADDRLLPFALEKVKQKFDEDEYDLVFGDVNFISSTGEIIYSYKSLNLSHKAIGYLRRVPFCQQSSFWTRRIFAEKGQFDDSLKYVADGKFFLDICLDSSVKKARLPMSLAEFRLHQSSFSVSSKEQMKDEGIQLLDSLKLKKNILLKVFYETLFKLINIRQIAKKMIYRGPKLG